MAYQNSCTSCNITRTRSNRMKKTPIKLRDFHIGTGIFKTSNIAKKMGTENKIEISKNQDQICNDNDHILALKYKKIMQHRNKIMSNMKIELNNNPNVQVFAEKYLEYRQQNNQAVKKFIAKKKKKLKDLEIEEKTLSIRNLELKKKFQDLLKEKNDLVNTIKLKQTRSVWNPIRLPIKKRYKE